MCRWGYCIGLASCYYFHVEIFEPDIAVAHISVSFGYPSMGRNWCTSLCMWPDVLTAVTYICIVNMPKSELQTDHSQKGRTETAWFINTTLYPVVTGTTPLRVVASTWKKTMTSWSPGMRYQMLWHTIPKILQLAINNNAQVNTLTNRDELSFRLVFALPKAEASCVCVFMCVTNRRSREWHHVL